MLLLRGLIVALGGLVPFISAQASNTTPAMTSNAPSTIFTFTPIPTTISLVLSPTATQSQSLSVSITTLITTTISSSYPISTILPSAPANTTSQDQKPEDPLQLKTVIDPAFATLGAILILTGLPSAFWGHKNRWTSFFLIGFYTLALACVSLIIRFGVLEAVHPPSKTLRGLFLLSSVVAGILGGGITIFFWQHSKYFIGAWGGFAFGLWLQCFSAGGVIKPLGYRWFLYLGCAVIGFCVSTVQKCHYYILLFSTAIVGATSFILGIDCFTTAGLKEFYVYNLGFRSLFPKYSYYDFPLTQTMMIEIGLIAAVTIMGGAVQLRILAILKRKLKEIDEEQRMRDAEVEQRAARRFEVVERDLDRWEKDHGNRKELGGHERNPSTGTVPTTLTDRRDSSFFLGKSSTEVLDGPPHLPFGTNASTPGTDTENKPFQATGPLPTLDLGTGIEQGLGGLGAGSSAVDNHPELQEKLKLLKEIQDVRRSLDVLKAVKVSTTSSAGGSSGSKGSSGLQLTGVSPGDPISRPQSVPLDADIAITHPRPPRETNPAIIAANRPQSLDWDSYVRERKLFTPPAGVTPPIPVSLVPTPADAESRVPLDGPNGPPPPLPPAVSDAVGRRKEMEKLWEAGIAPPPPEYKPARRHSMTLDREVKRPSYDEHKPSQNSHDHGNPVSKSGLRVGPGTGPRNTRHNRSSSAAANIVILPPNRASQAPPPPPAREQSPGPESPKYKTYEELQERHRSAIHAMQDPLSRAEQEQKRLDEAKMRWERSRNIEKQVMSRKEREQLEELEAAKKRESKRGRGTRSPPPDGIEEEEGDHRRTRSVGRADEKRVSTSVKVQEWKKHVPPPQPTSPSKPRRPSASSRHRLNSQGVPFSSPTGPDPAAAPARHSFIVNEEVRTRERPVTGSRPVSAHIEQWNMYNSPGSTRTHHVPPN